MQPVPAAHPALHRNRAAPAVAPSRSSPYTTTTITASPLHRRSEGRTVFGCTAAVAPAPAAAPAASGARGRHRTQLAPTDPGGTATEGGGDDNDAAAGSNAAVVAAPAATAAGGGGPGRELHLSVRVAGPGDAAALVALDASCAAEGSSGWSEGVYQAELRPGGPNLVLLCEVLTPQPSSPPPSASSSPPAAVAAAAEPQEEEGGPPDRPPGLLPPRRIVALAAGSEVAGEVSLTNLAVDPGWRGAGLGRRMVEELLRRLGAERYPALLEVRQDNAAAIALYGRLGFEAAGLRKRYYPDGCDGIVMVRQPAPLPLRPPPPS